MLRTLLESQATPIRRAGGTAVSIGVHTAVIGLVIVATARATSAPPKALPDPVVSIRLAPKPTLASSTGRPSTAGTTTIVIDTRVLVPPVTVPVSIPPVDPSKPVTNASDFGGTGAGLGSGIGSDRGLASSIDSIYTVSRVEKAAMPRPDNPRPVYPPTLRAASLEGMVVAHFVVDTTGRAEPRSITFAAATHPLFAEAVRQTLLRSRYLPAMIGDRPVRQLVEQRFTFAIQRRSW